MRSCEMVPIFNISSAGGSATWWLTRVLNQHPRVVCLHALRDDPFHNNPISVAEMIGGLRQLQQITHDTRSFGVIHSFYDHDIREPIKAAGGGFLAILRHPISRTHSLFVHHYRDLGGHPVGEGGIYATLAERGSVGRHLPLFEARVAEIVYADLRNVTHAPAEEIAVFERMTTDASYCRRRLETLLDEDLADFEPRIAALLGSKSNQHAGSPMSPEQIFDAWPRPFRDCFQRYAARIGLVGVRDAYRRFGYDIAPMLVG